MNNQTNGRIMTLSLLLAETTKNISKQESDNGKLFIR